MNFEGMRRRGFSAEQIQTAKNIYKLLYRDGLTLVQSMQAIELLAKDHPDSKEVISLVSSFLSTVSPQRGIVR
jgi:UDP-N-acetylglucosamine acyltransferase